MSCQLPLRYEISVLKSDIGIKNVLRSFRDMCTHFYLQYQSQELKDIMQAAVDSKLANRLIHERAKPEDLLSYALTDMIMEKATENDEKDEPKGFLFITS